MLFWIWFALWPIVCILIFMIIVGTIDNNNSKRAGWARTPWHPSFGLLIENGKAFVTLQFEEKQFTFKDEEDLEKLVGDGQKQLDRSRSMNALLDDAMLKSRMDKELESL